MVLMGWELFSVHYVTQSPGMQALSLTLASCLS